MTALVLRPLTPADVETIAAWGGDDEFCRRAGWTVGLPAERHRAFWRAAIAAPPPELLRLGAVHGGTLVGYVDLHGLDPTRRELGFVIGERGRWGQGLGTAAANAGLAWGFDELSLAEIWAEALDANQASIRILQRLGLTEYARGDAEDYAGVASYYRQFRITHEAWRRGALG
jgi:RimJ/RimL family protein N-acetyltransferase